MATAISGMLEGVGFWNDVRQLLERAKTRSDVFAANVGLALLTGAVGCSQAIAVVMTHSIMRITYAQRGIQDEDVMLDFENSGILIAPLLPWNIAAYVPVVMMGTSTAGYVPFAFFLYLITTPLLVTTTESRLTNHRLITKSIKFTLITRLTNHKLIIYLKGEFV